MLLILTNREDLTADYLIIRLQERGIPYYRFNVDEFPCNSEIVRAYSSIEQHGKIKGVLKGLDLEKVSVVWYRRSLLPPPIDAFGQENVFFVQHESRHFLEGAFLSLNVPWVNPLGAVHTSERKLLQLRVAVECGLTIPETIISNCQKDLKEFVEKHQDVICKPIYSGLQLTRNGGYSIYTHKFNAENLEDKEAIQNCPTLLQRCIQKKTDIRLTFFGEKNFAVSINDFKGESPLDWRRPEFKLSYKVITLPNQLINACSKMLKTLGLVYGAFDFVQDEDNNLFFLEVNPAGEWAWLDRVTSFNLRDELINLFVILRGSSQW